MGEGDGGGTDEELRSGLGGEEEGSDPFDRLRVAGVDEVVVRRD